MFSGHSRSLKVKNYAKRQKFHFFIVSKNVIRPHEAILMSIKEEVLEVIQGHRGQKFPNMPNIVFY